MRWTLSLVRYTSPYQSRSCTKKVPSVLPGGVMEKSGWKYTNRCSEMSPDRMIRARRMLKFWFGPTAPSPTSVDSADPRSCQMVSFDRIWVYPRNPILSYHFFSFSFVASLAFLSSGFLSSAFFSSAFLSSAFFSSPFGASTFFSSGLASAGF